MGEKRDWGEEPEAEWDGTFETWVTRHMKSVPVAWDGFIVCEAYCGDLMVDRSLGVGSMIDVRRLEVIHPDLIEMGYTPKGGDVMACALCGGGVYARVEEYRNYEQGTYDAERFRHPNGGDKYTPITVEVLSLIERMRTEHGSWRLVAARSGLRLRVLRNIRHAKRKCISQRVMDRLVQGCGIGSLEEFPWFTPDDLIKLGIWDPIVYFDAAKRVAHPTRRDDDG